MIQDNRQPDERPSQIAERIETQVKEMSLADVIWELNNFQDNAPLFDDVYILLRTKLREHELPLKIYDYLDDLLQPRMEEMIVLFGVEQQVRDMMIAAYVEREVYE